MNEGEKEAKESGANKLFLCHVCLCRNRGSTSADAVALAGAGSGQGRGGGEKRGRAKDGGWPGLERKGDQGVGADMVVGNAVQAKLTVTRAWDNNRPDGFLTPDLKNNKIASKYLPQQVRPTWEQNGGIGQNRTGPNLPGYTGYCIRR